MLNSATERPSGVDGLEPADDVRSAIERYRDAVNRHDERTFDTEELIIAGDRAVVRWRHHWVDRSGRPGHVRGVDVLRVRDGKVAEKLSYVKG